jgi:HEAT repeat protein
MQSSPRQDDLFKLALQCDPSHQRLFETILSQGKLEQRNLAARALGWMRSASCVPALVRALQDLEPSVRRWSVASLALSWDDQATLALGDLFIKEPDRQVRAAILRTLGWQRAQLANPICLSALQPCEAECVRAEAVRALGRIDVQTNLGVLINALDDPSALVRQHALRTMLNQPQGIIRDKLIERSHDEDPEARAIAIRGIAYYQDESLIDYLIRALDDDNPCVRANAAIALGKCTFSIDIKLLINKKDDPHPEVRARIKEAIQKRTHCSD